MARFSAKTRMLAIVSKLLDEGFHGVDIDGHYEIDEDQTHVYANADLDVAEVESEGEYQMFDADQFFHDLFTHVAEAFREGRRTKVAFAIGSGYPNVSVGTHVVQCRRRGWWGFGIEYFVMTCEMRRGYLRDVKVKGRQTARVVK